VSAQNVLQAALLAIMSSPVPRALQAILYLLVYVSKHVRLEPFLMAQIVFPVLQAALPVLVAPRIVLAAKQIINMTV